MTATVAQNQLDPEDPTGKKPAMMQHPQVKSFRVQDGHLLGLSRWLFGRRVLLVVPMSDVAYAEVK